VHCTPWTGSGATSVGACIMGACFSKVTNVTDISARPSESKNVSFFPADHEGTSTIATGNGAADVLNHCAEQKQAQKHLPAEGPELNQIIPVKDCNASNCVSGNEPIWATPLTEHSQVTSQQGARSILSESTCSGNLQSPFPSFESNTTAMRHSFQPSTFLQEIAGMWEISGTSTKTVQGMPHDLQITNEHLACADGSKYDIEIQNNQAVACGNTFFICEGQFCCKLKFGVMLHYQRFSLAPHSEAKMLQGEWSLISGTSAFARNSSLVIKGFTWMACPSRESCDIPPTQGFLKYKQTGLKEVVCLGGCQVEVLPDGTLLLADPFHLSARYGRDMTAAAANLTCAIAKKLPKY